MNTFNVEFLGCKVNAYEVEALREGFLSLGMAERPLSEAADLYVLNTCSVTANAGSTSRNRIRRALRRNPDARVVVTGCYAESDRDQVEAIEGVAKIFGNEEKEEILGYVAKDLLNRDASDPIPPFRISRMGDQTRAFVKIEDGCDDNCTFCIIPALRGEAKSRQPAEIIAEVEDCVRSGHLEVVLTAVHLGYYGKGFGQGRGEALIALLNRLAEIPGLLRLKLSSIEVHEITDELVQMFASSPVFAPHFHLPLQAGCDRTLRRMRRKYNVKTFRNRVQALRANLDNPALSTDVIVGFPGETDEDFAETLAFCREMDFMKIHVFPYSVREGTPAASFDEHVAPQKIDERKQALLALDTELGKKFREASVGSTVRVLIEGRRDSHTGLLSGLTSRYLRVLVDGPDRMAGHEVLARVDAIEGDAAVRGSRVVDLAELA